MSDMMKRAFLLAWHHWWAGYFDRRAAKVLREARTLEQVAWQHRWLAADVAREIHIHAGDSKPFTDEAHG